MIIAKDFPCSDCGRISRHFPSVMAAPPSLRSLLLLHLRTEPDGKRICIHCPSTGSQKTVFSAGTAANAWEFHLNRRHKEKWEELQQQSTRSAPEESPSDIISLAPTESSEPLQKKQRTEQPAAAASSSSGQSSMTSHFSVTRDRPALQQLASALIQGGVSYRFDLKEHRHELVRQQQNKLPEGHKAPLSLLKPNDTRWSST
jgi:hypothetical protein